MISELRDRINQMQDDIQDSKDRNGEIERLKDQCKKLKLEAEIKDNQVRTLKVKLDHFEGENEHLKQSKRDEQVEQQIEQQLKSTRNKLKKTEGTLKKVLEALKRIGREVTVSYQTSNRRSSVQQIAAKNQPRPAQQEDPQLKQYLKDSVNILGMSMDELMDDFVAPKQQSMMISEGGLESNPNARLWDQQLNHYLEKLTSSEDAIEVADQICALCIKLLNEISGAATSYMQSPK